jgi:hypothetical protein
MRRMRFAIIAAAKIRYRCTSCRPAGCFCTCHSLLDVVETGKREFLSRIDLVYSLGTIVDLLWHRRERPKRWP